MGYNLLLYLFSKPNNIYYLSKYREFLLRAQRMMSFEHILRFGGPEASGMAAMISTDMLTFFQSTIQKNLKSLYQSFIRQKSASAHVCANRMTNKFLVRSIQTRLDCVVKPLCPKIAMKINIGTLVQSL